MSRVAGAREKVNFIFQVIPVKMHMSRQAVPAAHYLDLLPRGSFRLHLLVRLSARLPGRSKKKKKESKSKEEKLPIEYSSLLTKFLNFLCEY